MVLSPYLFTNVINGYLPEPQASLLNGIIFGVPLRSSHLFYNQLKAVGLLHIVVLSGMNITILADFIIISTSSFSKKVSLLTAIFTVVAFVIFVGPQAPIIRAAIMGLLTLTALLAERRAQPLYSLFIACFLVAVFKPAWLKTISFQLSVGATLGLILFARRPKKTKNKLADYLKSELSTSLSAQIFTAPLIFLYFHQVSLISPLANILVAWAIAPLMILGFLAAILGKIAYPLGIIPAYLSFGVLKYFVWVVNILSHVPGGYIHF